MPVSKNRKNHKRKVNAYKERVKQKQNQFRKSYMDLMNKKREEELQEEIDKGEVENVIDASEVDIGEITDVIDENPDLDLGDMEIEKE